MFVWAYISVVYMSVYTCICICVGVHVCVRELGWVLSVYLYLFVCSVACYSVSDLLGWFELGNGRFRFVPILDLILGDSKTDPWDDP